MHSNMSQQIKNYQKLNLGQDLHRNLDDFIQTCLNKFQFAEPKKEFYDVTGEYKDFVISHKSTIPDLVIWNKKFNKNECFEESDLSKSNLFPRFKFFLKLDESQKRIKNIEVNNKNNNSIKSNQIENNEEANLDQKANNETFCEKNKKSLSIKDISKNYTNLIDKLNLKENKAINKQDTEVNLLKEEKKGKKITEYSYSNKNNNNIKDSNNNVINLNNPNNNKLNIIQTKNNSDLNQSSKNNATSLFLGKNKNNLQFYSMIQNINKIPPFYPNHNNYTKIPFNNNNFTLGNSSQNIYNNKINQNSFPLNYNNNYQKNPYYEFNYMNSAISQNKENLIHQKNFPTITTNKDKKTMNDYYQNQFKQNELLMNFVYSFLQIKGWIIFKNNGNYISNFTSFELFTFLTDQLKHNNNIKMYKVGMSNNSMMFNGEQIYIILSQTLPIILQKKQYDLIHNEMMKKKKMMKEKEDKIIANGDINENIGQINNDSYKGINNNNMNKKLSNNEIISKDSKTYNNNNNINFTMSSINNDNSQDEQDIDNYNFCLYNEQNVVNTNEDHNNNKFGNNEQEKKYIHMIGNNLFINQNQENKMDYFDDSIFRQIYQ